MRRLRALIFTVTCVVGTVLFSAGATGSDRSAFCAVTAADRFGCEEHLGPVVTRTAPGAPVASAASAVPVSPAVPAASAVPAAPAAPAADRGPAGEAPAGAAPATAAPAGVAPADVAAAPAAVAGGSSSAGSGAVAAGSGTGPEAVPPAELTPADRPSAASGHGRPITATAVMHVPTPEQPASEGQMAPLTDKAMVLLVGWVMLVLLGGGVCAGSTAGPNRRRVRSR